MHVLLLPFIGWRLVKFFLILLKQLDETIFFSESTPEPSVQFEDNCGSTEFVAFARIFSGTLRKGQEIFVLGPKHDPSSASQAELENYVRDSQNEGGIETTGLGVHALRVTIDNVYVLMGRELELVDAVPAGNILGNISKILISRQKVFNTKLSLRVSLAISGKICNKRTNKISQCYE